MREETGQDNMQEERNEEVREKFVKLNDVSYNDADINAFSRLDAYWITNFSKLQRGIKVRHSELKAVTEIGIRPYDVMMNYKLKGIEFGRWVKTIERHDLFCSGVLALEDLAQVLGYRNLGFDHNVGISFGGRGRGGANAHFEPDTMMINLTKLYGANSLAHEYGHAIDYFLGMRFDVNRFSPALSGGRLIGTADYSGERGPLRRQMDKVIRSILATKSYANWYKTTENPAYKCNHTEMFARCFEQWVANKLYEKRVANEYLTKLVNMYTKAPDWYLTDSDCKKVFPHIATLVRMVAKAAKQK